MHSYFFIIDILSETFVLLTLWCVHLTIPEHQVAAFPQLLPQVGGAGPVEQGSLFGAARLNATGRVGAHTHIHGILPVYQ